MTRPVYQRGMPRTGTTLVAKMLMRAFGSIHDLVGRGKKPDKHGFLTPGQFPDNTVLLINIKDPYSWLVSWHAWVVEAHYQGTQLPRQKAPVSFSTAATSAAIEQYNEKYRNWMESPYEKVIIRYEDVLADTKIVYRKMAKTLGEQPDRHQIREAVPGLVVRPGRTRMRGLPAFKFDRAYYEEKQYLDLLTPRHIEQVTAEIDWELLEGLYEPITEIRDSHGGC